jgi:hypothetical protein
MSGTTVVKLTWERLGRRCSGNPRRDGFEELVTISKEDGDELAEAIFRIARKGLVSPWFDVSVLDDGTFYVESGRFGKGRWEIVTTVSDGNTLDKP